MKPEKLYSAYWSLGEGKGIRCNVFSNYLELIRIEKENDKWVEKQRIGLPKVILEKLYIRLPKIHSLMGDGDGEKQNKA